MLLKISFLLPRLFCNVEFEFNLFHNTKQSSEILILKIEKLLEFQSKTNIEITWFLLMILYMIINDFWNIDLLDTYPFRFVRYRYPHFFVSKTSWRCLEGMSWRRLGDAFSVTIFGLIRHLEDVLKTSWKTKNCYAEDVLKTSSWHALKRSSRRLQDQQMFARKCFLLIC